MSALANLKSYWSGNSTLNTALPATSVFLDIAPPQSAYPYATISLISAVPILTTGVAHIEQFQFQVSLWHSSLNSVEALADTVDGQFSQAYLTNPTLICTRANRISRAFVNDANYTYNVVLSYLWTYNSVNT